MPTKLSKTQACLLAAFIQLLACAVIYFFKVPNPNIILFVVLSAVLVQFGYLAGSICGAIAFLYSAFFFSTNHSWFSYTPINSAKLLVIGIGIIMNILIIGQLQRKLEKTTQEKTKLEIARQVNASREQLLSNMSHDIRTPLNGIIGMLKIIQSSPEDKNLLISNLHNIEAATLQLLSLTNDAIDLNYLRNSKNIQVEKLPFNLQQTCEEAIAIAKESHSDCELNFSSTYAKQANMPLLGSAYLIRRILLNLYSNAIKYNKPHGFIHTSIRLIQETEATAVFQLQVKDNGIGMSQDFAKNHLFEMFAQENPGARTKYQGSGLGMPIVKHIVDVLHGAITVDSAPNEGTCFTLEFTFDKNPDAQSPADELQPAYDIHGTKILLVEDNELNIEIASHLLSQAGAIITKARNGAEALRLFKQSPAGSFDIILMDIMMPVMNGLETAQAIRQLPQSDARAIPIFAMTANVFPEDREKSLAAGMNEHLPKPLDIQELIKLIYSYSLK